MKTAAATMAVLIVTAAPLSALSAQTVPVAGLLERLDGNGDGTVSKDEIAAARERLFKRFDLNGDGTIDDHEVEVRRDAIMDRAIGAQARLGREMHQMDANGDGKVSQDEFRARTVLFDLVDRDSDGRLSAAEFAFVRGLLRPAGR